MLDGRELVVGWEFLKGVGKDAGVRGGVTVGGIDCTKGQAGYEEDEDGGLK